MPEDNSGDSRNSREAGSPGNSGTAANSGGFAQQFVRVAYDVERTATAIEQSQLPNDFAEYLRTGGKMR
jgi:hypothetical protein